MEESVDESDYELSSELYSDSSEKSDWDDSESEWDDGTTGWWTERIFLTLPLHFRVSESLQIIDDSLMQIYFVKKNIY